MSAISAKPLVPPTSAPGLRWQDRTPEINERISRAFRRIAGDTSSQWGLFNGYQRYGIADIQEHELMQRMVQQAPPVNKDFYALDIGAGNYQWGRALAESLNATKGIPKDVTIHIIGIRGEQNLEKAETELGQCKLYEFGQFQIETLTDEFQKRGLSLANKVDLIVSRWCFRHLAEPVGTFMQAYDLLRPETGHFLFDGFYFLQENETLQDESLDFREKMIQLCLETRAPFLTRRHTLARSLDHFAVKRHNGDPCHLHKQYLGMQKLGDGWQINSETMTRFKNTAEDDAEKAPLLETGDYRGDKGMYEWLRQNGLLDSSALTWGPLQDKDIDQKTPPLHRAIAERDEEAIYRCLEEGCDINESDEEGSTPLHLAIKHNNYKLFVQLLEKRALTTLFANGRTPLHLAMQYDWDGCFITDLIAADADINITQDDIELGQYRRDTFCLMPLDYAIQHQNVKAVALLLQAGGIVNYSHRQLLDKDPIFSSIYPLLPKRGCELKGFDTIISHIQGGDCVLLTYPGQLPIYTWQRSAQPEKEGQLIRVTVNPKTRLLNDRNYEEISDKSNCTERKVRRDTLDKVPDLELLFGY